MFSINEKVKYQGEEVTVVRAAKDADGDIIVRGTDGFDRYARESLCSSLRNTCASAPEPKVVVQRCEAGDAIRPSTISETPSVTTETPQGNAIMANAQNTSRRTVKVTLIDRDVNLEGKDAIVLDLGSQVSEGSTQELIQELIMDPANKVAEALKAHNDKRAATVNREVLNRTGNKVKLLPVKIGELHWDVQ